MFIFWVFIIFAVLFVILFIFCILVVCVVDKFDCVNLHDFSCLPLLDELANFLLHLLQHTQKVEIKHRACQNIFDIYKYYNYH